MITLRIESLILVINTDSDSIESLKKNDLNPKVKEYNKYDYII